MFKCLCCNIKSNMKAKEVRASLKKRARGGRLSCKTVRRVAEALGVPYRTVGMAADELGLKITHCELGCF